MPKFKVRFNLGAGKNYMKWKVTDPFGKANYYEPDDVYIKMSDCRLMNHRGTAEKIYNGQHKTVCAWVEAVDVEVLPFQKQSCIVGSRVSYNPKVKPYWVLDGEDADKKELKHIVSVGRKLFKLPEL